MFPGGQLAHPSDGSLRGGFRKFEWNSTCSVSEFDMFGGVFDILIA